MLSSVSFSACTPIGIKYPYDGEFQVNQQLYSFTDHLNLYISPMLASARDVAVNNQELIVLSDYISLEDCVEQNKKDSSLIQFSTTVHVSGVGYWDHGGNGLTFTPDKISDSNVFTFRFDIDNSTVEIISNDVDYLTFNESLSQFVFEEESVVTFNGISPQKFNYILDGNNIALFTNLAYLSSQYSLAYNADSGGILSATRPLSSNGAYADNSIMYLGELPVETTDDYEFGQSNWVQYTSPTYAVAVKKSINKLKQNVLITSPFKTVTDSLSVDINGLKNFLTPDAQTNIDKDDNVNQRDYYGVFAGHNQEDGYGNVFLAYEGGTQGVLFKKDKFTWFHYPTTSQSININDTTIALNGAVAGTSPFKADKVFKKKANYKTYSNWGESLPIYEQNGAWLCTWLSGSPDPDTVPVWVDRYLNPTLTGAVSSANDLLDLLIGSNTDNYIGTDQLSAIAINSSFITNIFTSYQQAYIDIASEFTFDPGVLYVYHHIGEENNKTFVSLLSGATRDYYVQNGEIVYDEYEGTRQLLYYTTWAETSAADNTSYRNTLTVTNSLSVKTDDRLVYNTAFTRMSAYGITNDAINLEPFDGFTLSVNVYADDWNNLYGDQIIGNYFNGGVGLFVNNKVLTPTFYMYESTQGRTVELNSDFYMLRETKLSNTPTASSINFVFRRDYDDEYFVIDSGKNALRYDSANILVSATPLSGTITGTILDVQQDGLNRLHILATDGVYEYNTITGEITFSFNSNNAARLVVDNSSNVSVLGPNYLDSVVDGDNNIFAITSTGVYRNGNLVFNITNGRRIACDINNNIWLLHDNKISKLTNVPYLISTTTLPTSGITSMCLNYNLIGNGVSEEYIAIIDETNKNISYVDMDGVVTSTVSISALSGQLIVQPSMNFKFSRGDVSGYDYQRKFGRRKQSSPGVNAKIYAKHKVTQQPKIFALYADTSKLTSGWHNFAVVFNSQRGNAKLFIDGDLISKTNEDVNPYQFAYRATNNRNEERFVVGASSSKNGTLNERIRQSVSYVFDGGFNEVRLFNTPFSDDVIEMIARNGYTNAYDDMSWNMPVGNNQYLEEIERFFKHRLPGNKSQFFNLKIRGYKPTTDESRDLFENNIRAVISKIVPAYTQVKNIEWVD